MKTIRKSGHAVRPFLEGLSMIFDLGGFLHPQPPVLGDFSEDAAEAGSDWVISHTGIPTPLPPERRKRAGPTPGRTAGLPDRTKTSQTDTRARCAHGGAQRRRSAPQLHQGELSLQGRHPGTYSTTSPRGRSPGGDWAPERPGGIHRRDVYG